MGSPSGVEGEALLLLRRLTGNPASVFRPGQLEAIQVLVVERRRVLLVQRTEWGKMSQLNWERIWCQ